MLKIKLLTGAVVLAAAAVLALPALAAPTAQTIRVVEREYGISLSARPKAGATVFVVRNSGEDGHDFWLRGGGKTYRSRVLATGGTAQHLRDEGLEVELVKKVLEGRPHVVDAMKNGDVQLVFNTTEGRQSLEDSFSIRRTALMMKIPYFTTTSGAHAAAQAVAAMAEGRLEVRALQNY